MKAERKRAFRSGTFVFLGAGLVLARPAAAQAPAVDDDCVVLRFEGPWNPNDAAAIAVDMHTAASRRRVSICSLATDASGRLFVLSAGKGSLDDVTLSLDTQLGETLTRRISLHEVPEDGRVFAVVIASDELLRASRQRPQAVQRTLVVAAVPAARAEDGPLTDLARAGPRGEPTREPQNALSVGLGSELYAAGQTHLGPILQWQHELPSKAFATIAFSARRGFDVLTTRGVVRSTLLGARGAVGYAVWTKPRIGLSIDAGARFARLWFTARGHSDVEPSTSSGWLVYTNALAALVVKTDTAFAAQLAVGAGLPLISQAAVEGETTITGAAGLAVEAQTAVAWRF